MLEQPKCEVSSQVFLQVTNTAYSELIKVFMYPKLCLHLMLAGLVKDGTFFLTLVWTVSLGNAKRLVATAHGDFVCFFVKYILKSLNIL